MRPFAHPHHNPQHPTLPPYPSRNPNPPGAPHGNAVVLHHTLPSRFHFGSFHHELSNPAPTGPASIARGDQREPLETKQSEKCQAPTGRSIHSIPSKNPPFPPLPPKTLYSAVTAAAPITFSVPRSVPSNISHLSSEPTDRIHQTPRTQHRPSTQSHRILRNSRPPR